MSERQREEEAEPNTEAVGKESDRDRKERYTETDTRGGRDRHLDRDTQRQRPRQTKRDNEEPQVPNKSQMLGVPVVAQWK